MSALLLAVCDEEKQKIKRKWSKQWFLERRNYSHINNSLRELQSNEPADFKNYLRMDSHTSYELLSLVRSYKNKIR